ncbi:MAG: hypothetical protein WAM09_07700 [Anaerolineales bacterium]
MSAKSCDLLAYFVTFSGELIPAEKAFEAIWAEKPGKGMTASHTAFSRLRNALWKQALARRFVLVEPQEYHLDAARFNIDVDDFDAALANTRAVIDDKVAARWLEQVINLNQGEYLQDLYYERVFPER